MFICASKIEFFLFRQLFFWQKTMLFIELVTFVQLFILLFMGIIARQGFWNTLSQYTGIGLAFINTIVLVPWVFSIHPESQWGVVQYLLGISMILTPLAHLGVPNAVIRFFPYFREQGKSEFFMLVATLVVIGFSLTTLGFLAYVYLFSAAAPDEGLARNTLLFVIPMLAGHSMTVVFSSISRAHFRSTIPVVVDQLLLRVVTMVLLILFGFEMIEFSTFLTVYVTTFLVGGVFMALYIRRFFSLKFTKLRFPSPKSVREVIAFVLFSFLSGEASIMFMKLDVIMIKGLLDLESVALYSVPFYVGSLIMAPLRAIVPISFPIVANFWKEKSIGKIKTFYAQTARNQVIVSGFVFVLIWLNIDLLLYLLGDTFGSEQARWVFFFVGLAQLINAASGNSDQIINASAHYKNLFVFKLLLLSITIALNFVLIPRVGIPGAAMSVLVAMVCFSFLKFGFLYYKYGMQPYNVLFFKVLLVLVVPIAVNYYLVRYDNLYLLAGVRVAMLAGVFWFGIYRMGISPELKELIRQLRGKILRR